MARGGVQQAVRNEPLTQEQVSAAGGAAMGQLGSSARLRTSEPIEGAPQDQGVPGGGVPAALMSTLFDFLNREIRAVLYELRIRWNARFGTIEEISADHTVALTEEVLLVTAASNVTVTLPAAEDYDKDLVIKKVDSGAGTVTPSAAGSDTYAEATTLASQYDTVVLFSHGTAWYVRSSIT